MSKIDPDLLELSKVTGDQVVHAVTHSRNMCQQASENLDTVLKRVEELRASKPEGFSALLQYQQAANDLAIARNHHRMVEYARLAIELLSANALLLRTMATDLSALHAHVDEMLSEKRIEKNGGLH